MVHKLATGKLIADMASKIKLLAKAWRVATERQVDHRRKGKPAEPCVNHLAEIADVVAKDNVSDRVVKYGCHGSRVGDLLALFRNELQPALPR